MAAAPDVFQLRSGRLCVQEVVDGVSSPACGATSLFIGTTREDELDGRKVIGLDYEAYEPMAQSEFSKLCADVRGRWPSVAHICLHHRLGLHVMVAEQTLAAPSTSFPILLPHLLAPRYSGGEGGGWRRREETRGLRWCDLLLLIGSSSLRWVEVGEASVVMAISSPHRHDSQHAIQHSITQMKANIPIWKKEVYDSQEVRWKENAECCWSTRHKAADRSINSPEN